jgi:anti-sigma regulatory factor (Ser/Thr protein kinase)
LMVEANDVSPTGEPIWALDLDVHAGSGSLAQVRQALSTLAIPDDVLEDAKVLASELVGNSVKHAGLQVSDVVHVRAEWTGDRLRVAVHDRSRPTTPLPVAAAIRPRPGAESGWGLFIVDRLASRWGTDEAGYWFELDGSRVARR